MGRPPKLSEDQWKELVDYYHEGHTYNECGVRFGVSLATVENYFRKHKEIPRRKPMEPARPKKNVIPGMKEREGEHTPPPGSSTKKRKVIKLKDDV